MLAHPNDLRNLRCAESCYPFPYNFWSWGYESRAQLYFLGVL